jgi:hypothetical protein
MHVLHNKSVVDSKPLIQVEQEEQDRVIIAQYKSQVRHMNGPKVHHDKPEGVDPRWKGLKMPK